MGTAGNKGDLAKKWGIHRSIPTSRYELTVNTTGSIDLAAVTATDGPNTATARDLRGVWVYLTASGGDVTIQRGNAPASAGLGLVIVVGQPPQEFFLDPDSTAATFSVLHAVSSVSAKLHVMWDDEQVAP